MATTTYTDITAGVRNIGERTTSAPAPATDLSAEEDRYANIILSNGILTKDALMPVKGAGATWNVILGSGTSKADYALLAGTDVGQGNYIVRPAGATETVAVSAADPTLDRIDEIYLVVLDDAYDSSTYSLPRYAVSEGVAAGSPSVPGPDAAWDAYLLIATVNLPGGAADIVACTLTDERVGSGVVLHGGAGFAVEIDGTLVLDTETATDVVAFKQGGVTTMQLDAANDLNMGTNNIVLTGNVDGLDLNAHDHDGTGTGGTKVNHADLLDLTAGDPHTQYLLASTGFTKATVDALGINAIELQGTNLAGLALVGHNHSGVYLPVAGTAAEATILETARNITLSGDATGSASFNGSADAAITVAVANDSHTHETQHYTETEARGRFYGQNSDGGHKVTFSTSAASSGSNGDIWFRYA